MTVSCWTWAQHRLLLFIAANKAQEGRVYAFEPSTDLSKKLFENVSLNKLNNINIYKIAVGNKKEQVTLHLSEENNSGTTGLRIPYNFSGKTEIVQSIKLDDWANEIDIGLINIVKIDVEGYDKKVLDGLQECIEKYNPIIFIEVVASQLSKFDNAPADIYDFFYSYGYKGYVTEKPYTLKEAQRSQEGYSIIFIPQSFQIPLSIEVLPNIISTHR